MRKSAIGVGLVMVSLLVSCIGSFQVGRSEPTPTSVVMADTDFSGCAYLDQDDNGIIDPGEPLLGGLTFTITLAGGMGFGGGTGDGRCGFILVPGALPADAWPIMARMVVPEDFGFKAVGPTEIMLQHPQRRAEFLFVAK